MTDYSPLQDAKDETNTTVVALEDMRRLRDEELRALKEVAENRK